MPLLDWPRDGDQNGHDRGCHPSGGPVNRNAPQSRGQCRLNSVAWSLGVQHPEPLQSTKARTSPRRRRAVIATQTLIRVRPAILVNLHQRRPH